MRFFGRNLKWHLFVVVFCAAALVWYAVLAEARGDVLTVAFLDVGQGDATFIEAPNGVQILIDGGPNAAVLRALSGVMPFYDRSIDMVVATHPDADHIGGLPSVFKRFHVSHFIEPGARAETGVFNALQRSVADERVKYLFARRGMRITLDEGVLFSILFPDRDVAALEPNAASVIALLEYGDTSFLLTGDAPRGIEEYVAAIGGDSLDVDILKVGHHGSKTSTSEVILGVASPGAAVISAGRNNRYGHPHKAVIDLLDRFDIEIFNTADDGTVVFESDGRRLRVIE